MNTKREYHTRQKEMLMQFFEQQGASATAEEIRAHLQEKGICVGQATVYRHLDRLAQEGIVAKYPGLNDGPARYRYIGDPAAHKAHSHLVCMQCGKIDHLECAYIDNFSAHIQSDHRFQVDRIKTIFYGYCQNCNGAQDGSAHAQPCSHTPCDCQDPRRDT